VVIFFNKQNGILKIVLNRHKIQDYKDRKHLRKLRFRTYLLMKQLSDVILMSRDNHTQKIKHNTHIGIFPPFFGCFPSYSLFSPSLPPSTFSSFSPNTTIVHTTTTMHFRSTFSPSIFHCFLCHHRRHPQPSPVVSSPPHTTQI